MVPTEGRGENIGIEGDVLELPAGNSVVGVGDGVTEGVAEAKISFNRGMPVEGRMGID